MLTNGASGVLVNGHSINTISLNPKGNNKQLYPEDIQVPLNFAIADLIAVMPKIGIQIFFTSEEKDAELVSKILKARFEERLVHNGFYLRHQQIISLTAQGYDIEEMAEKLKIEPVTVTAFRQEIYDYLESEFKKPRRTHSIIWYAARVGLGL